MPVGPKGISIDQLENQLTRLKDIFAEKQRLITNLEESNGSINGETLVVASSEVTTENVEAVVIIKAPSSTPVKASA